MVSRELLIVNRLGLHARAAAKLVATAGRFSCAVRIERDGKGADAKSIMAVMMLAAGKGTPVTVRAEGDDEVTALEAVDELINDRFGEDE
jgi:phosphocarrier protein HPr